MNKFIEEDKIADQKDSWYKELEERVLKGIPSNLGCSNSLFVTTLGVV